MYHNDPNSDISPKGTGAQSSGGDGIIDFSTAKRLKSSGMTCDAYVTRYLLRNVFVKRIKEEKRNDNVICAAFAKEAELGFSLDHKALPRYIFRGNDYIVMDFVDGQTLSSMIAESDPWLENPENIRQMLTVLIDVIDYLHRHNVIHCDVKCDNVMITRDTRNVMLIDLGEAYTFALDNTAGNPEVYGLDKENNLGNPDIDFRGLGKIIDRLQSAGYPVEKFKRFRELCDKPDVTPTELLAAIKVRDNKKWLWVAIGLVLLSVVGVLLLTNRTETVGETSQPTAPTVRDTVVVVQQPAALPESDTIKEVKATKPKAPDYKSIINKESARYFVKLVAEIDSIELLDLGKMPDRELTDCLYHLTQTEYDCMMNAYQTFETRFPNIGPVDVQLAVANSPGCTKALRRHSAIAKRIADIVRSRHPELEDLYNN